MNLSSDFLCLWIRSESSQVRRPKQSSNERGRAVSTCDEHISEGNLNASLCMESFQKYRILKYSTSH